MWYSKFLIVVSLVVQNKLKQDVLGVWQYTVMYLCYGQNSAFIPSKCGPLQSVKIALIWTDLSKIEQSCTDFFKIAHIHSKSHRVVQMVQNST